MRKLIFIFFVLLTAISCTTVDEDINVISDSAIAVETVIKEYDVVVNEGGEFPLSGKLLIPETGHSVPLCILVHGSGVSDYNETIYSNTPFLDIATALAEKGIATLRYDKRYFRNPQDCDMSKIGAREETIDDVNYAINMVKNDPRFSALFIIGHSLGGCFAPAIAVENEEIDGIVSLAGSLRPLYEIMYDQMMAQFNSIDTAELTDELNKILNLQLEMVNHDMNIFRNGLQNVSDGTLLFGIPASYWKSLDEYWADKFIKDVTVPMLICQGGKDFQVYPDKDYPLWIEALNDRDDVEFCLYPELNHLFIEAGPINSASDYYIPGVVDNALIEDISDFVKKIANQI